MIVVDTSVAVKWTFSEPGHSEALLLLELGELRTAPDLILPELLSVVRKKRLRGEATSEQAHGGLRGLEAAIDKFVPSLELAASALALSETLNHSPYDCFFLAAAVGAGVLVTADDVFARKSAAAGYGEFVFTLGGPLSSLLAKTTALDLPPATTVEELKRLARVVEATFLSLTASAMKEKQDQLSVAVEPIRMAFKSPAYLAMRQILSALTREQLSAVLAAAWLGRPYHSKRDWPSLVANAKSLAAAGFHAHEAYFMAQLATLPAGAAKLLELDLSRP